MEVQIRGILINSSKNIEQIGKLTRVDQTKLIELLSIMELEGIVQSMLGRKFSLK